MQANQSEAGAISSGHFEKHRSRPPNPEPEYLRAYSAAQLRVILSDARVRQVVAAAGSGKTRTVIGAIEYALRSDRAGECGVFGDDRRILLLSFSRRAVAELRARLPADLRSWVEVSTFHSFCFRWLARLRTIRNGQAANGAKAAPLRVISDEEREAFLRDCLQAGEFDTGGIPYAMLFQQPERFRALFPEAAAGVFRRYRAYKRATGLLEYDDLVQQMLAGLRAGAPGFVELRARFPLVIVDEFQDTDPDQLEFLQLLRPRRLTVVGDDWQAIYAFRGATVRPFLDFRRSFEGVRVFRLSENYRSLRPIVRLGNRLIRSSRRQLRKRVRAVRGHGPGLPVLGYSLYAGDESRLAAELSRSFELSAETGKLSQEFRILVRTNYRRSCWIRAGFAPEQVLTIHKAKGLEFPVVFVDLMGGWTAGAGAHPPPTDEEIRVLYVAASRAENLLVFLRDPEAREESSEFWYWRRLRLPGRNRDVSPRTLRKWLTREAGFRQRPSHSY